MFGDQGLTRSAATQQRLFDLAGGSVQQANVDLTGRVTDDVNRAIQQTNENYLLNRRVLDMARQYQTEVFHNQQKQAEMALHAQSLYNASNRQLLQQQQKAFMLGNRANQLAAGNQRRITRETDALNYESRLTQLQSGLQPTGMGGALFGALAQGVGVAAGYGVFDGLFGGGGGGGGTAASSTPQFGLTPTPSFLRNTTTPTNPGMGRHTPFFNAYNPVSNNAVQRLSPYQTFFNVRNQIPVMQDVPRNIPIFG